MSDPVSDHRRTKPSCLAVFFGADFSVVKDSVETPAAPVATRCDAADDRGGVVENSARFHAETGGRRSGLASANLGAPVSDEVVSSLTCHR